MVKRRGGLTMAGEKEPPERRLSTSRLARGLKLSSAVLGTAGRLGVGAVRRVFASAEKIAQQRAEDDRAAVRALVAAMGKLKGASMKLGQMLSYVDPNVPEP